MFRVGERQRMEPKGTFAVYGQVDRVPQYLYFVCRQHDFDQIQIERDRSQGGFDPQAVITADRAGHSARVDVEAADVAVLFGYRSADVLQQYCETLARQLEQLSPRRTPRLRRYSMTR
jgi:hypothetical protein